MFPFQVVESIVQAIITIMSPVKIYPSCGCVHIIWQILRAFQSTVDSQNFLLVLCSTPHLFTMNSEIFSSAMQPFAKATIEWFGHGAGPEDARLVCSEQISLSFCI